MLVHNDGCDEWAESFIKENGGEVVDIRPPGKAPRLGPSKGNPEGDWTYHKAVRKDDKLFDEFNPDGVSPDEYRSQFEYGDALEFRGL